MNNEDMAALLDLQAKLIEQYEQYNKLQRERIEHLDARIADLESQMIEPENV